MKLNDLIPLFVEIVTETKFKTLGPPYTYQLAEEIGTNILTKNAMEIDIKSAFPTICKLMYGEDNPFVKKIYSIEDKIERNKYIAITLKKQGEIDNKAYLSDLNLWSKILTMGYIYSKFTDIVVIQYIKDGALFIGTHIENLNVNQNLFIDYIVKNGIIFHERRIDTFIRFNRTSIIKYGKEISIKGDYHDLPKYIHEKIIPSLLTGSIYDYELLNHVKKIYSKLYCEIVLKSSILDDVKNFYQINGSYLNSLGKLDALSNLDPLAYLRYIIYPILSLCRLNQNNL